jgi:hypothetical protein
VHQSDKTPAPSRWRRWRTVRKLAETWSEIFTEAAIRAHVRRAEPHYDARGELVPGNGLAGAITRVGGKGGRVLIDEDGFAAWIEVGLMSAAATGTFRNPAAIPDASLQPERKPPPGEHIEQPAASARFGGNRSDYTRFAAAPAPRAFREDSSL